MWIAYALLAIAATYAGIGVACAVAFVTVGLARVDPAAHSAPIGFRLLILPGASALWPVVLTWWRRRR